MSPRVWIAHGAVYVLWNDKAPYRVCTESGETSERFTLPFDAWELDCAYDCEQCAAEAV